MTVADHDGHDGLTLCEAYRLSGGSEKLSNAVARQFKMATDAAALRIRCGYVSVNGSTESFPDTQVEIGDSISIRPDPSGDEWDAVKNSLKNLMRPMTEESLICMRSGILNDLNMWSEMLNDLNFVIKEQVHTELKRRRGE